MLARMVTAEIIIDRGPPGLVRWRRHSQLRPRRVASGRLIIGRSPFSSIDWVRDPGRPQPVGSRSACLNFSARHTVLSLPLFTVLEVHSLGKMAVTALVVKAAGLPCAVEIASHG